MTMDMSFPPLLHPLFRHDLLFFEDLIVRYRWIVATLSTVYLYGTYWYCRMWLKARNSILLAPVSVRGGISEKVGAHEVGLILHTQWATITETFRKLKRGNGSTLKAGAESAALEINDRDVMRAFLDTYPETESLSGEEKATLRETLVVKVGGNEIPIGAIFFALVRWIPVPFRKCYEASLIRLSLVSTRRETLLLAYQQGQQVVLAKTATVRNLAELSELLRNAPFMILQLHGRISPKRKWLSMRRFVDGLDALEEYRRTRHDTLVTMAEDHFRGAQEADPDNYEALYVLGSMLMSERTQKSTNKAISVFRESLNTKEPKLRALVHSGLAFCYAQLIHRLARGGGGELLEKAWYHANQAQDEWRASERGRVHPLILRALALVRLVDLGSEETREKRLLEAAPYLVEAIDIEPNNSAYHNALGWLLLKLTEWEMKDLKDLRLNKDVPPHLSGKPATAAKYYLSRALELDPTNKLSHANLCLLYATAYFRERPGEERTKYLDRCRHHGLKAIQMDPNYINGHRDLSLSLLRYRQFDESYKYFKMALQLSDLRVKHQEIITDALSILEGMQVSEEEQERWRHPDLSLLVPADGSRDDSSPR